PSRIDGVLLPFTAARARGGVGRVLEGKAHFHEITMARVNLNDGQSLLAFNDFYLGQRTHLSSRYALTYREQTERHSSSGLLVVTGAGSTGWFSSTQNMAASLTRLLLKDKAPRLPRLRLKWDDPRLVFVVREPFLSKASDVQLTAGLVGPGGGVRFVSLVRATSLLFSHG